MTTGRTPNLDLALPVEGELDGTWGDEVNNGITDYVDIAIAGTLTLNGDGAVTLAKTQGSSSGDNIGNTTAQYAIIRVTGTLSTTKVITAPASSKTYVIINDATGGSVNLKASGQTGVTVGAGLRAFAAYNGTDYVWVGGDVTANGTQTLTNKTISVDDNTVSGVAASSFVLSNGSGNIDGAAAQKAIPAGVVVGTTDSQTLTNKTISADNNTINGVAASSFVLSNGSGAIDGSAAQKAIPAGDVVGTSDSQTLTNKTFNNATVINDNSSNAALRITQTGSGNALVVEDSANPDSTPFVVDNVGNLGLGVVPSAWGANYKAMQAAGQGSALVALTSAPYTYLGSNWYNDNTNNLYVVNGAAGLYQINENTHAWFTAPSGTAGNAISFTERFRISNNGAFGLSGANYGTANTQAIVSSGSSAAPTWQDVVTPTATQTLTNKTISGTSNTLSNIGNSSLTNSSVTINGTSVALGASATISAATTNALTIGTGLSGTSFNGSSAVTIAIDSTVATLTGSQTLTNKTISVDDNTVSGIAASSFVLSNASGNIDGAAAQKAIPSGVVVGTTDTQTLTNKTLNSAILNDGYTEEVFAITDGSTVNLDPNNGSIQTWTLGASRTPGQANWAAGQSITLMVDDGSAFTITWSTLAVVWETNGGSAPTLATSGFTTIVLWKVGTTIYGARVGDA